MMLADTLLNSLEFIKNHELLGGERLKGGGNNQIWKLHFKDYSALILKVYAPNSAGRLDRLEVEWNALNFMWQGSIRNVPEPIEMNSVTRVALLGFVNGARIESSNLSEHQIHEAVNFIRDLRNLSKASPASRLPIASEATYTAPDLLKSISKRLERLTAVEALQDPVYRSFAHFRDSELLPKFNELSLETLSLGNAATKPLEEAFRTLSPSDFGFHNSLMDQNGKLYFLDFEYFGWDDPVKLSSDFVLHPGMTLSLENKKMFIRKMFDLFESDRTFQKRLDCYLPLYALKWSCIILNEFIPDDRKRREFAGKETNQSVSTRLKLQLDKATIMLNETLVQMSALTGS